MKSVNGLVRKDQVTKCSLLCSAFAVVGYLVWLFSILLLVMKEEKPLKDVAL